MGPINLPLSISLLFLSLKNLYLLSYKPTSPSPSNLHHKTNTHSAHTQSPLSFWDSIIPLFQIHYNLQFFKNNHSQSQKQTTNFILDSIILFNFSRSLFNFMFDFREWILFLPFILVHITPTFLEKDLCIFFLFSKI